MISDQEKLDALEREIRLRHRVYPRLIDKGRISQAKADYETRVMIAIRDDYAAKVKSALLI